LSDTRNHDRHRIAAIRAHVLAAGNDAFEAECPCCAEAVMTLIQDDAREHYVAELQRDDCPRHRVQQIRRAIAVLDSWIALLCMPRPSNRVH
jgi:hypothetical protein